MSSLKGLEKWYKSPECQSPEHKVTKSKSRHPAIKNLDPKSKHKKPAVKNSNTKSKPNDKTMVDSDSKSESSNPVQLDVAILAFWA